MVATILDRVECAFSGHGPWERVGRFTGWKERPWQVLRCQRCEVFVKVPGSAEVEVVNA